MILTPSQVTRQHLSIQSEAPPISLIHKRCACAGRATAKQLAQHGKCAACVLADVIAGILPDDMEKLQFMLGAVLGRDPARQWGARNHYLCNVQDRTAMQRLVGVGLAEVGRPLLGLTYFHATVAGCKAAGLNAVGIKRATGKNNDV